MAVLEQDAAEAPRRCWTVVNDGDGKKLGEDGMDLFFTFHLLAASWIEPTGALVRNVGASKQSKLQSIALHLVQPLVFDSNPTIRSYRGLKYAAP